MRLSGYRDHIRFVIGLCLPLASLVLGAAACSDEPDTVSCRVEVGGAQTTVSLDSKAGASSVAKVASYSVTFSVVDGRKLEAEVRDATSSLMKVTTGDVAGKASGSMATPDGQLQFTCNP